MQTVESRWSLRTGRLISGLAVAFLIFDSVGKLLQVQPVIDGPFSSGTLADVVFGLGVTLLGCVLVYLVPATSVLGAVLLTGYLGGAVATHVRVGSPLFTTSCFPTYVAALLWGGAVLRDARLRALSLAIGAVMSRVTSKDGTSIAYERSGNGPALILVDGALCSRAFGPSPKLAPLLARHFTVYAYDRRGRGESGDTQPYSPAREVEDIAALIEEAGGAASSPRAVVRRGARPGSRGRRPPDRQGGRVRAAVRRRRRPARRRRARGSARSAARRRTTAAAR